METVVKTCEAANANTDSKFFWKLWIINMETFSMNMETSIKTCEWQIQGFKIVGKARYFSKESKLKEIKCLKAKVS